MADRQQSHNGRTFIQALVFLFRIDVSTKVPTRFCPDTGAFVTVSTATSLHTHRFLSLSPLSLPLCWFALFTYRSNDFVATSTEQMRIFSGSSSKGPNPLELRRSATALDGQQDIILRRLFRFALAEDSPFRTLELAQASAGSHVADFCRLSRVGDAPRRFLSAPTCCAGQFMPVGFLTWSNNFFSRFSSLK